MGVLACKPSGCADLDACQCIRIVYECQLELDPNITSGDCGNITDLPQTRQMYWPDALFTVNVGHTYSILCLDTDFLLDLFRLLVIPIAIPIPIYTYIYKYLYIGA